VDVGKNTPKKSPAGKVRRDRVAAQNQPAGNLQKRCCTNRARDMASSSVRDLKPPSPLAPGKLED